MAPLSAIFSLRMSRCNRFDPYSSDFRSTFSYLVIYLVMSRLSSLINSVASSSSNNSVTSSWCLVRTSTFLSCFACFELPMLDFDCMSRDLDWSPLSWDMMCDEVRDDKTCGCLATAVSKRRKSNRWMIRWDESRAAGAGLVCSDGLGCGPTTPPFQRERSRCRCWLATAEQPC